MSTKKTLSFIAGFLLLFFIYHFPEFFTAFWIMAVFKIGFILVAFFLALAQGWKGLGGYGLGLHRGWGRNLAGGILIGLTFFGISMLASYGAGFEEMLGAVSMSTIARQLPMLLLMTAIPSIAEDILTRGYLFGHIGRAMKPAAWVLVSSAVYVLNHIWRLDEGPAVLIYLFLLGAVLAYTVWITHSLWLAFGIHWGANIAFESSRSFIHSKSLVTHEGSTWLLAACWGILLLLYTTGLFTGIKDETGFAAYKRGKQ